MTLVIKNRNSLLIVTASVEADDITNWRIWLQEVTVFRDAALMEEDLSCLLFLTIIVNGY